MLASIDPFFSRKFKGDEYNCLHFTREVWLAATGEDLGERLDGLFVSIAERRFRKHNRKLFEKLDTPESPCLVLMQRANAQPHIGVYLRGNVLHITEIGVEFQPVKVASRGFVSYGFYK